MDKLVKKNSGHYGYGQLNNTLNDLRNQKWSADTWHDALKGNGGFNQPKYQQLITEYRKNHLTTSIDEIRKGAADDAVRDYEHTLKVNQAVGVQSEYAYDEVNTSLDRIHKLSQQIENAENTKAAIDLNSRLLTEVAYLQTQNLKSQSLINQQLAQKQSIELSERSRTAKYLAFDDEY